MNGKVILYYNVVFVLNEHEQWLSQIISKNMKEKSEDDSDQMFII